MITSSRAFFLVALVAGIQVLSAQIPIFNSISTGTANPPFLIASADLNADNKPDVIVSEGFGSNLGAIEVFLNNGNGTMKKTAMLNPPQVPAVGGDSAPCIPFYIATGDFVKDGKQDLLVVCSFSPVILVYPGNGDGTFTAPVLSTAPTAGVLAFLDEIKVAIGDFNNDGFPDIAFAQLTSGLSDLNTPLSSSISILFGSAAGKFSSANIKNLTFSGSSLTAADVNKDGKLDLIISQPKNFSFNFLFGTPLTPGPLQILLGKGDGTFTTGQSIPLTFAPGAVTVADINGDGKPDLLVDGYFSGMAVLTGNGDGTFKQTYVDTAATTSGSFQVADLLGTGKPGLLAPIGTCCSNQIVFLPGNGDGTFQNYLPITTGISSPNIVVGDFNGDGKPDLALSAFPVDLSNLANLFSSGGGAFKYTNTFIIDLSIGVGPIVSYANGASFAGGTLAAGSIVSAFGPSGLAGGTDTPGVIPLPVLDQGTGITIKDSLGSIRNAPLFYVSPTQINLQIPDGTAAGTATFSVNYLGQSYLTILTIATVAPGIFQANPATHLLSADVTANHADGSQTLAHTYLVNTSNAVVANPVNLGAPTDQVFLTLYATGIKNAHTVNASIGGTPVPVAFVGPQGTFVGLDQINLGPIPHSLAGAGTVNLMITADTIAGNVVNLAIQ